MSRFITLWAHPDYAPDSVNEADLETTEHQLNTQLPLDYREAVLEFGLPRPTIALLDTICDRQLDLSDVSDFLGPQEIVTVTEEWRELGLPEELFAFATDCMGNLFCFPTAPRATPHQPVFLWNHDSGSVETVASSFSQWLESYCDLSPN